MLPLLPGSMSFLYEIVSFIRVVYCGRMTTFPLDPINHQLHINAWRRLGPPESLHTMGESLSSSDLPGNVLTDTPRGLCLLGDCRSRQVDNQESTWSRALTGVKEAAAGLELLSRQQPNCRDNASLWQRMPGLHIGARMWEEPENSAI